MVVSFCGHSQVTDSAAVADSLAIIIESLIQEGADEFYLGGYANLIL